MCCWLAGAVEQRYCGTIKTLGDPIRNRVHISIIPRGVFVGLLNIECFRTKRLVGPDLLAFYIKLDSHLAQADS